MGKGQIVSGGTDGQYQVKLIYAYRSRVEQKILKMQQNITSIEGQITTLDAQIAAETDIKKKESLILRRSVLNLQKTSIQKQIEYYQNNMPADPTVSAWCMDLTEDLSGNVGTAEIPGEPSLILIRPGYSGRATYSGTRDGQLMPSIAGEPNQVLFNWMLLPGWQRYNPIYRVGTIVPDSIDFDANTCSVCLDAAYSSQQNLTAIDGAGVTDCDMGDDPQAEYLTAAGEDFCTRNPGHPFCTQAAGFEILLTNAMLAQLREVNYYVNGAYGRANDPSGIVAGDRWDVMVPGDSGDCEDFALTKMQRLVTNYGWNPNNLKLVTAYAKNGAYHAMLGVRTTNRGLVVLDVNYNEIMESGRVPYRLDKIALTSDTWTNYSRRLDAVPIEYMQCNAGAFADGDRVVVEFVGQSWSSPKVIGFLEGPQSCVDDKFCLYNGYAIAIYTILSNAWKESNSIFPNALVYSAGAACNGKGYLFGGYDFFDPDPPNARADAYQINIQTESMATLNDMPSARVRGCGGKGGSKVYCAGGSPSSGSGIFFNSNYEFDTDVFSWSTKSNLLNSRRNVRGFSVEGSPVYAGGKSESGTIQSVEKYNVAGDSFTSITSLPTKRWADAQTGDGTNGYCFGGYLDEGLGDYNSPTAIKYSGGTESWSGIQSLPDDAYWYYNEFQYPASLSLQFSKVYVKRSARDRWVTGVSKSRHLNSYDILGDSYNVLEAETRDENDIASTAGQALGPSWVL